MRNYSPHYQFWVERADMLVASRDSVSCTLADDAEVEITPVGARSVTIRINGRWIADAGAGESLVDNLLGYFEDEEYDVSKCGAAMEEILDDYYPE